jgi:hypothetical protein
MNLNHQIKPVSPTLNVWRKLNEVIDGLNWIMSMYGEVSTDGNSQLQIIPGSRGPVFKMNVQASGNQQPWATDPDGNPTGWLRSIVVDPDYNDNTSPQYGRFDESWMWSGPVAANPLIPWFSDPDTPPNEAQWIMVNGGTNAGGGYYWGTGQISGTGNFMPSAVAKNQDYYSPQIWVANPGYADAIITPPANPPAIYLESYWGTGGGYTQTGPVIWAVNGSLQDDPRWSFNWDYTVTYDGIIILSASGVATIPPWPQDANFLELDPTGWVHDPDGLPGYPKGKGSWIYKYPGPVSTNTSPKVVQTVNFRGNAALMTFNVPNVVFITGN